jgi:hypothetical protein
MKFIGEARKRTDAGFSAAAKDIGCEPAVLRAVIAVEAGAAGFDGKGRPKALFEPHIFYRLLSGEKRRAAIRAGLAYPRWGARPYPKDSYPRIMEACRIDEECALQATSWGLPQILGQNHKAAGFRNATEMVAALSVGEDEQLAAMARFIVASKLDVALRRKNWVAFAKGYNGPSYAIHGYHRKLATAYEHFCGSGQATVPESLSADAKNRDQAKRLGRASKRSAAVALSAAVAAPAVVSAAGNARYGGLASSTIELFAIVVVAVAAFAMWRGMRRAELFK